MPTAKLAKAAAAVTATVLLLEFAARCEGALAVSGHQMVTWWGSNRAWRETPQMQERSLGELCSSSPFTVINLAYMVDHFSTRGLPALDFAFHCNETDILLCQSLGKRVLLSVSPYHETLASDGDGIRSAEQVWNVFLNGQSPFRPFGRAVLDGVDLYQRTNEKGYTAFAIRLRQLMDSDTTKQYLLSVSPECAFPSARVGPVYENTLLASAPQIVDYVNVMHLATQVCSFGSVDRIGFWNTVRQWNTWAKGTGTGIRFITGLPSWGWGFESWVNGMVGDFIYPDDLGNVTQTLNSLEAFAGVGLYDASYEFNNIPCEDRQERYSQIIDAMLSTAGSTGELGWTPSGVAGQ
ncbi:glycoside hydrolase superfamily [Hyaloraphidium curvatum]|nr:glycoside hydrolase superfamily [Hyaloraphidium curvatum]